MPATSTTFKNPLDIPLVRQVVGRIIDKEVYVTAEHVKDSQNLQDAFAWIVDNFTESQNSMFLDIQLKSWNGQNLTFKQMAAVIRVYVQYVQLTLDDLSYSAPRRAPAALPQPTRPLAQADQGKVTQLVLALQGIEIPDGEEEEFIATLAAETGLPAALVRGAVNQATSVAKDPYYIDMTVKTDEPPVKPAVITGTYTIVLQNGSERFIRIEDAPVEWAKAPGTQIASFYENIHQSRPLGFAWVEGATYRLWKTAKAPLAVLDALELLLSYNIAEQLKAGEVWAAATHRCFICGRTLKRLSSVSAGIGPVCARKYDIETMLSEMGLGIVETAQPQPRSGNEDEDLFEYEDERPNLVDADEIERYSRNLGGQETEDIENYNKEVEAGLRVYMSRHKQWVH